MIELLDDESEKLLSKSLLEGAEDKPKSEHRTLRNFFLQPCVLGKDLLTIEKFGLVQYVSARKLSFFIQYLSLLNSIISWIAQMILKTVCAFLALILELFGVYGDGEFKWYYGYALFTYEGTQLSFFVHIYVRTFLRWIKLLP